LIVSWFKGAKAWQAPALRAIVMGVTPIAVIILLVGPAGFKVPPIHDISTDLIDPPEFVAAQAERTAEENSLDHGGPELAKMQSTNYPNIRPLRVQASTEQTFTRAQAVVKDFGWRVIRVDAEAGVIEAVEETAVFGFKDDLIIRVLPTEEGSQVDVRSVSRVGVSDLGANAKRIHRVLSAMTET